MANMNLRNVRSDLKTISLNNPMWTPFQIVQNFLAGAKKEKIAPNTWLRQLDTDIIVCELYNTDVAKFYSDGNVVLFTGGYNTPTTRERIAAVTQFFCDLEQSKRIWYIHIWGKSYPFENNRILIDTVNQTIEK